MNRWRLPSKLGLIVGIPVLCVVAVALVGYRELAQLNRDVVQMVAVTSKAAALVLGSAKQSSVRAAAGVSGRNLARRQGSPRLRGRLAGAGPAS